MDGRAIDFLAHSGIVWLYFILWRAEYVTEQLFCHMNETGWISENFQYSKNQGVSQYSITNVIKPIKPKKCSERRRGLMRSFPFRYDVRRVSAQNLSNVGVVFREQFTVLFINLRKTLHGIHASNTTPAPTSQLHGGIEH